MNVLMPQLGETVAEGKIVKWFKSAGDTVKPGDNLFEIETDKTSMEVPATFGGTLSAINFQVGEVAKVGAVVAVIAGEGGAAQPAAPSQPKAAAAAPSAPQAPKATTAIAPATAARALGDERTVGSFAYPNMDLRREVRTPERNYGPARISGVTVTPLARRLAGERGIDLAIIKGSGPHGRIVAADVERSQSAPTRPAGGGSAEQVKALFEGVAYDEVPLDGMRATIAKRLIEAKQTVPHFYLSVDMEVGRLMAMRAEANAAAPKGNDGEPAYRLSLNDFIIKAWALALLRVPRTNAVWAEDRVLRFSRADIGVAVAIDGGLITPVLRSADTKSITAISAEMRELAARARERKLKPNEYQGGASAVSNLGMYGVREFAAIINPPHSTILAVGAVRRAPMEGPGGRPVFADVMTATLSCDHRVVDGADGALLAAELKRIVESSIATVL